MDADRFDALVKSLAIPRRRLLGGLGAGLLIVGAAPIEQAAAHRHERRRHRPPATHAKRQRARQVHAQQNNGNDACVRACTATLPPGPARGDCAHRCATCSAAPAACQRNEECCSLNCLPYGSCAANCAGTSCSGDPDCCPGYPCLTVTAGFGFQTCGGCLMRGSPCIANADCCTTDCTYSPPIPGLPPPDRGVCLSAKGGRCSEDKDCNECVFGAGPCAGACVNGACTI